MLRFRPTLVVLTVAALTACDTIQTTDPAPGDPALSQGGSQRHDHTPSTISLQKIGGYAGGGVGAAEITAFDPSSHRLFVVNGALGTVDVLDLVDPTSPTLVGTISVGQFGGVANSVATHPGLVAVAVESTPKTSPGTVAFYDASTLSLVSYVTVGAQPDMVTFSPSGKYLLSANEGEPNDAYTIDPEGSVTVIDVSNKRQPRARTAGFSAFNGDVDRLQAEGIRIYGPNATVAQDLEPEYITISDDGRTAFATLQENNALAIIDISSATVKSLKPLGYKNHLRPGLGIDASDRDSAVNIRSWPVLGMYQPDAIASYTVAGRTYLVTANEGDARDWAGFREEARVSSLTLNPSVFTDAICGGPCKDNTRLGRLNVTTAHGRNPTTGEYDQLYAFGARSFSIWTSDGRQIWDSGTELEERTAALPNVLFNASNSGNAFDDRSDNKGPEPEGVVLGRLGRKTFAFVGLERVGGIIAYDVSNPFSPRFATYINSREGAGGDLGPEGVIFISAAESPNGRPLVIAGHEVSGTTAIYEVKLH